MPVFIKNFFASMLFLLYAKGQLKLQYFCKIRHLATKLKLCYVFWKWRNSCYEVATTKPRYESYRECIENHRRESSQQKSSKYWWFMEFSERRMGKYHLSLDSTNAARYERIIRELKGPNPYIMSSHWCGRKTDPWPATVAGNQDTWHLNVSQAETQEHSYG